MHVHCVDIVYTKCQIAPSKALVGVDRPINALAVVGVDQPVYALS